MSDLFEATEPETFPRALAEYRRDEKRRRQERADNVLFAIACTIVAALFSLAWWMLP